MAPSKLDSLFEGMDADLSAMVAYAGEIAAGQFKAFLEKVRSFLRAMYTKCHMVYMFDELLYVFTHRFQKDLSNEGRKYGKPPFVARMPLFEHVDGGNERSTYTRRLRKKSLYTKSHEVVEPHYPLDSKIAAMDARPVSRVDERGREVYPYEGLVTVYCGDFIVTYSGLDLAMRLSYGVEKQLLPDLFTVQPGHADFEQVQGADAAETRDVLKAFLKPARARSFMEYAMMVNVMMQDVFANIPRVWGGYRRVARGLPYNINKAFLQLDLNVKGPMGQVVSTADPTLAAPQSGGAGQVGGAEALDFTAYVRSSRTVPVYVEAKNGEDAYVVAMDYLEIFEFIDSQLEKRDKVPNPFMAGSAGRVALVKGTALADMNRAEHANKFYSYAFLVNLFLAQGVIQLHDMYMCMGSLSRVVPTGVNRLMQRLDVNVNLS